ncbi:SWIM zinc finger family protein [Hyalangium versicolor]|uniref:SWIM zinc finger family protein n=1 Tax=Hyalangium versicolor TaxID=2861190 RepID=UPI001CD00532|nr:SWIM zinc finger family protein [Hyalangium versicolor]
MTLFAITYATPSVFESTRERALLGLTVDQHRPVRFHARVKEHLLSLRLALQALGSVVWSNDEWFSADELMPFILDPVITVHPDRVFFEAFSQDQSTYGLVIADRALFEPVGEVRCGTTNVDFTAWLWAALAEMRSSRETFFRMGPEGFEVTTAGAGGRFEQKVDIPDDWVRGFLQLQGAMAMPGTRLSVRPVDLLAALRFLRFTKAKVSPRALRYELEPGQDAALVLEPWEERIPLRGAEHTYAEKRTFRTWGRRRLQLLDPLLPYADGVDVYLKGRALPSFYAVKLPGVTFLLGLSGWTSNRWTGTSGFDLLVPPAKGEDVTPRVLALLSERYALSVDEASRQLGLDKPTVSQALASLCAAGRALFDVERREFRHRELFSKPVDLGRLYPPDARREEAESLVARGQVQVQSSAPRETRKKKRLKGPDGVQYREVVLRDWMVTGTVGVQSDVELVLNDEDRLIFGRCGCDFFQENLLNQGPCAHLLALLTVAKPLRKDLSTSRPVDKEELAAPAPPGSGKDAREEDEDGEDEALDGDEGDDDNR